MIGLHNNLYATFFFNELVLSLYNEISMSEKLPDFMHIFPMGPNGLE